MDTGIDEKYSRKYEEKVSKKYLLTVSCPRPLTKIPPEQKYKSL